jgi:hypothetical protein
VDEEPIALTGIRKPIPQSFETAVVSVHRPRYFGGFSIIYVKVIYLVQDRIIEVTLYRIPVKNVFPREGKPHVFKFAGFFAGPYYTYIKFYIRNFAYRRRK